MYSAIHGHAMIVNILVNELTRKWSFDVFRVKNCMGHTAESLAKKNGRMDCAAYAFSHVNRSCRRHQCVPFRLLKRERIQMFQKMHRQLALIHFSAQIKGWENYGTTYKAKDMFMQRRHPHERTMTVMETPNLPKLSQRLMESTQSASGRMYQSRSTLHLNNFLQLPDVHTSKSLPNLHLIIE